MGPVGGCFHGEQESSSAGGHPTAPSLRDPAEMETHVCPCDSPHPWHKGLARPLSGAGAPACRMPPPESFMLSQCFQGKDNLCPRAHTAPCTTLPSKDHFQSILGKDISLPHCPAPRVAMENTSGRKKNITIIPFINLFFFQSHSLAETTLSHFHNPPCPQAGVDGYGEQCGFEAPSACRGGDRVPSSTAAVIPL